MKHGYVYFILIALICIGCGADSEIEQTTGPARIIEIKKPKIHTKTDKIYADFDIVFSSSPMDLAVEPKRSLFGYFIDWEQQGNIVTLYYRYDDSFCVLHLHEEGGDEESEGEINRIKRTTYPFDVTLAWNVGRKSLTLEIDYSEITVACEGINYSISDFE